MFYDLIFNFYNTAQTEDRQEILRVIEVFLDIELYFSTALKNVILCFY